MSESDLMDQLNNFNKNSGGDSNPKKESPEQQSGLRLTRIDVKIPAIYTLKGHESDGLIINISSGGIAMEVRQIFVLGDIIRIQFKLPNNKVNGEVDFWGIVKNVSHGEIGLKFEELSHDMEVKLEEYVNDMLRSRGLAHRENF